MNLLRKKLTMCLHKVVTYRMAVFFYGDLIFTVFNGHPLSVIINRIDLYGVFV